MPQNDSTNSNSSTFIAKSNSVFQAVADPTGVSTEPTAHIKTATQTAQKENGPHKKIQERINFTNSESKNCPREKLADVQEKSKMTGRKIAETILLPFLEKQLQLPKHSRNIYVSLFSLFINKIIKIQGL